VHTSWSVDLYARGNGLGSNAAYRLLKAKQLFYCKKNRQRAEAAIQQAQKGAHLDGPQPIGATAEVKAFAQGLRCLLLNRSPSGIEGGVH
jgi:hypothetical protein